MAAVELAHRPCAVPDVFDVELKGKVAQFYENANTEEAFFALAPKSLNEALTFLFLVNGWTCEDFRDYSDFSYQYYYDIVTDCRVGIIKLGTLCSILHPLAPGYLIGDRVLELGGVCVSTLNYKVRKILYECKDMSLHEIRQLAIQEKIYNFIPNKLQKNRVTQG
ncbi:hypothetical protein FACS1894184_20070 [Clostridia bacterium]|nr:hypothetical protein FACS1894184_20070 [Clostridia bacterium]